MCRVGKVHSLDISLCITLLAVPSCKSKKKSVVWRNDEFAQTQLQRVIAVGTSVFALALKQNGQLEIKEWSQQNEIQVYTLNQNLCKSSDCAFDFAGAATPRE